MKTTTSTIIFIISLVLTNVIVAQRSLPRGGSSSIMWGQLEKGSNLKKYVLKDVANDYKGNVYTFSDDLKRQVGLNFWYRGFEIEKFDQYGNLVNSKQIKNKYKRKKLLYEFSFEKNNVIFVCTTFNNYRHKKKYLFIQSINKQTLEPNEEPQMIAYAPIRDHFLEYIPLLNFFAPTRLPELSKMNSKFLGGSGEFMYRLSNDSSKLMLLSELSVKKKDPLTYNVQLFDAGMNRMWDQNIGLPFDKKEFEIKDFTVSNNGEFFVTGIKHFKGRESSKAKAKYTYHILKFKNNGEFQADITPELNNKFIIDAKLGVNNFNEMFLIGYYAEMKKNGFDLYEDGVFLQKYNTETLEKVTNTTHEFSSGFKTEGKTKRAKKKIKKREKKNKSIDQKFDMIMADLIFMPNGAITLVSEQYKEVKKSSTTSTGGAGGAGGASTSVTTSTTYYLFNDIFISSLNTDGSLNWNHRLVKRQSAPEKIFSSYSMGYYNNELNLVYNCNTANFRRASKEKNLKNYSPYKKKDNASLLVKIEPDGKIQRKLLSNRKEDDVVPMPSFSNHVGNKMFIHGFWKRKSNLGILTL